MMATIGYYKNDATGELAPPHRIGETEDGRPLYQFVNGWTPVDSEGCGIPEVSSDEDGNWFVGDDDPVKWVDQQAVYPARTGDYDEYIKDQIVVQSDWTTNPDPFGNALARFPGDRPGDAEAWLVEHGLTPDRARRMIEVATACRPEALSMMARVGTDERGWAAVGQGNANSVRRDARARVLFPSE